MPSACAPMRFMGTGTTRSFPPSRQSDRIWSTYFAAGPNLADPLWTRNQRYLYPEGWEGAIPSPESGTARMEHGRDVDVLRERAKVDPKEHAGRQQCDRGVQQEMKFVLGHLNMGSFKGEL